MLAVHAMQHVGRHKCTVHKILGHSFAIFHNTYCILNQTQLREFRTETKKSKTEF